MMVVDGLLYCCRTSTTDLMSCCCIAHYRSHDLDHGHGRSNLGSRRSGDHDEKFSPGNRWILDNLWRTIAALVGIDINPVTRSIEWSNFIPTHGVCGRKNDRGRKRTHAGRWGQTKVQGEGMVERIITNYVLEEHSLRLERVRGCITTQRHRNDILCPVPVFLRPAVAVYHDFGRKHEEEEQANHVASTPATNNQCRN